MKNRSRIILFICALLVVVSSNYVMSNPPIGQTLLVQYGDAPDEYRLIEHDSLVITPSNGIWHWKSRQIGGNNPVKLLIEVWDTSYPDAVLEVLGERHNLPQRPADWQKAKSRKPFALPPKNDKHDKAISYLLERGISREIIDHCLESGLIYESSGKYNNCVFVGKDTTGKARFACSRGIGTDFKRDAAGSEKRYNFCLEATGNTPCDSIAVFESPIDALSMATINRCNHAVGTRWKEYSYLALGGTAPLALLQYLKDRPEVSTVYLFLDNDKAGIEGMAKIREAIQKDDMLAKQVVEILEIPPKRHKDYNEQLLAGQAAYSQERNSQGLAKVR